MLDVATTQCVDTPNAANHPACYGYRAGWIVATTHPQAELHADANLRHRGYRTFLPLHHVRQRDRATPTIVRIVQRPLWPGYLFVAYDSRDPRRPIRETPGVRDLVRCGPEVQWVPDHALEAIQEALQADAAFSAPQPLWKPGTPCSLATGAFYGMPAVVTEMLTPDTATIAILMFGALRQISVNVACLVPRDE